MKISAITYECLTSEIDYEGYGVSYTYAIGELRGSVQFTEKKTCIGILTAKRSYVLELDITPDMSRENAAYWAKTIVGEFAKTRKAHKSMKSFASSHRITIAFYSCHKSNYKNLTEYYRYVGE